MVRVTKDSYSATDLLLNPVATDVGDLSESKKFSAWQSCFGIIPASRSMIRRRELRELPGSSIKEAGGSERSEKNEDFPLYLEASLCYLFHGRLCAARPMVDLRGFQRAPCKLCWCFGKTPPAPDDKMETELKPRLDFCFGEGNRQNRR